jgi:hypothetical protein
MPKLFHGRLFAQALVASVVLNVLMIAAGSSGGAEGGAEGRSTLLTRFSDAVADSVLLPCCMAQNRACFGNRYPSRAPHFEQYSAFANHNPL